MTTNAKLYSLVTKFTAQEKLKQKKEKNLQGFQLIFFML